MKKAILVRHETLKPERGQSYCHYFLEQEDDMNGFLLMPLPFITLACTPKFKWRTWWRLQKQVIAAWLAHDDKLVSRERRIKT